MGGKPKKVLTESEKADKKILDKERRAKKKIELETQEAILQKKIGARKSKWEQLLEKYNKSEFENDEEEVFEYDPKGLPPARPEEMLGAEEEDYEEENYEEDDSDDELIDLGDDLDADIIPELIKFRDEHRERHMNSNKTPKKCDIHDKKKNCSRDELCIWKSKMSPKCQKRSRKYKSKKSNSSKKNITPNKRKSSLKINKSNSPVKRESSKCNTVAGMKDCRNDSECIWYSNKNPRCQDRQKKRKSRPNRKASSPKKTPSSPKRKPSSPKRKPSSPKRKMSHHKRKSLKPESDSAKLREEIRELNQKIKNMKKIIC